MLIVYQDEFTFHNFQKTHGLVPLVGVVTPTFGDVKFSADIKDMLMGELRGSIICWGYNIYLAFEVRS